MNIDEIAMKVALDIAKKHGDEGVDEPNEYWDDETKSFVIEFSNALLDEVAAQSEPHGYLICYQGGCNEPFFTGCEADAKEHGMQGAAVCELFPRPQTQVVHDGWRPIDTAPKYRRILLGFSSPVFTGVSAIFGKWEDEKYAKNPKPYWGHDLDNLTGKHGARANQPTHWMPLPLPPQPEVK